MRYRGIPFAQIAIAADKATLTCLFVIGSEAMLSALRSQHKIRTLAREVGGTGQLLDRSGSGRRFAFE